MSLAPGTRLGPYEVVGSLGAGGMGEVYRAKDMKLGREVALKLLPEHLAHDPERLARFEREARTLASLNHPHIAQIHGLEDASGTLALVMELVEGPTLADRIAEGPLPLDEVLPIAHQIAEALEAAHDQGIVHRDLKPANIKVRPDGTVKVLDFGLAKATAGDSGGVLSDTADHSPTITSPAMTMRGVILGTAAYMSPEQAKGKPLDRRADIWAFGCVLFEMLTGRRAFQGDDVGDTLAAVLRGEPAWSALPASTPPRIRTLLRRCIERDTKKRLPHIGAARLELMDDAHGEAHGDASVAPGHAPPPQPRAGWRTHAAWAAAALVLTAGGVSVVRQGAAPLVPAPSIRFQITPPPGYVLPGANGVPRFSMSPDGAQIVFAASLPGQRDQLFIRRLRDVTAQPLRGTESPPSGGDAIQQPFFSPDGRHVAFFSGSESLLKRVPVDGGPAERIASMSTLNSAGTWHGDVILASSSTTKGVQRVPSSGGDLAPVTSLNEAQGEVAHLYPQFLPDGTHFLFTVRHNNGSMAAHVGSLDGGPPIRVVETSGMARFVAPDQLLYPRERELVRQTLDLHTFAVLAQPTVVVEDLLVTGSGRVGVSSSNTGVLALAGGLATEGTYEVQLRDRAGRLVEPGVVEAAIMTAWVRLSPDGQRLAFVGGGTTGWDVWTKDLARGVRSRLTTSGAAEVDPVWSPDGSRLAYSRLRYDGVREIVVRDTTGLSPERQVANGAADSRTEVQSWSSDGRYIVFRQTVHGGESYDLMLLAVAEGGDARPLLRDGFRNRHAAVSPDSTWMAYASNESSYTDIFVRSFPDGTRTKFQVSADGGMFPRWRRDGRELYYMDGRNRLVSVPVDTRSGFSVGAPTVLFELPQVINLVGGTYFGSPYDVSADGQRFYVVAPRASLVSASITVVVNWMADLKP